MNKRNAIIFEMLEPSNKLGLAFPASIRNLNTPVLVKRT